MFDQPVKDVMQREKLLTAAPDTFIAEAARQMAARNAGAIAVITDDRLVGIITERDIVFRVVAQGRDVEATRIADVMTPNPLTITVREPFGRAMLLMQEGGFRHLPVVDGSGKLVGIVSARSAMDPDLEEFVAEAERREHYRNAR